MRTEHARKASVLKVSVQGVMQDQGWYGQSLIDCLKSSLLALISGVAEH